MKKKWFKKGFAVLLAWTMVLSLFPGLKGTPVTVHAAEDTAPTSGYWTDTDGLKAYNLGSSSTAIGKIKFGLNGSDARLWAICGEDGGNLALLATSVFGNAAYGSTRKYSMSNFVTNMSDYLKADYFSKGETDKMAEVTVTTMEPDDTGTSYHKESVENKKLYLPNSYDQYSMENKIYVGSNNDIAIDITKLISTNGFRTREFWLRSPYGYNNDSMLVVYSGGFLDGNPASDGLMYIVPAFNLDLESVIFASAANAASPLYSGYNANSSMTENTYTLRYLSSGKESAVISADGTEVTVTNANGKYLMIQNNAGVYVYAIYSDAKTVNASEITEMALDNFNNCKVWLESTDEDRITTAKMATPAAEISTEPIPSTPTYTIISEAGEAHELSADGTLTITCDGALDKLTEIYVDDKLVDAANYTLKSGSTILTFKAEYLNTLSVGTHKVKFQYNDGSVETTISIKQASTKDTTTKDTTTEDTTTEDTITEDTITQQPTSSPEKDEVPKTGDSAPIAWLFVIAIINGASAVYFGREKRGGH